MRRSRLDGRRNRPRTPLGNQNDDFAIRLTRVRLLPRRSRRTVSTSPLRREASPARRTTDIGLGMVLSVAARRWLEPQLFDTSAKDPLVLIGAAVVLEVTALLGGWIPARRAVTVRPTDALRAE